MKQRYSIAICPPDDFVAEGKKMKLRLAESIGWFNSKNSDVHITVNVFECEEGELETWKEFLHDFCKSQTAFEITFTKTGSYSNGAFYLDPDNDCKQKLVSMMKQFHEQAPFHLERTSIDPHLSIARRLKRDQLKKARELFPDSSFNLLFLCDNLAVRKFDSKRKQYFVESRFLFSS